MSEAIVKSHVFISYSRKDSSEFANRLVAELEVRGFDAFLDKKDILPGEDWKERLGGLIAAADTVVFLLSPESVKSEYCAWEVDEAERLAKRVLPTLCHPLVDKDVPGRLSRLQRIDFSDALAFDAALASLENALLIDIAWLRELTRLVGLAEHWEHGGRDPSQLMCQADIAATEKLLTARPPNASLPPQSLMDFYSACKAADEEAQYKERIAARASKRMQTTVMVLMAVTILGLIAFIKKDIIVENARWYSEVRPYIHANFVPYILSSKAEHELTPGQAFRECASKCPEMVVISAGTFIMGSPASERGRGEDEGPQHEVRIRRLAVSKFAVTFDDWDECVAHGGCPAVSDADWGRERRPVINVSWNEAQKYVAWLSRMTSKGYRLLSEAEWEYAARAGTVGRYDWGDDTGNGNANCNGCGSPWDGRQTAPSGSFRPNAFGLYDMHGNVSQWVEDCYHSGYEGAPVDGAAWTTECTNGDRRVARGGSWNNYPTLLRSAYRVRPLSDYRYFNLGFRIGRTLLP